VENLRDSVIDEIIITDSIPLRAEIRALKKVKQLSLSEMLAETIRRISNEESISAMFEY
jgi:ribose-phosphate pyrophosphokinase